MRFEAVAAVLLVSTLICNCGESPPPYQQPWGHCYFCGYGVHRVNVRLELLGDDGTYCANKSLAILQTSTALHVLWYNLTAETPNLLAYKANWVTDDPNVETIDMRDCDDGENPGFCPNDPMLTKEGGTGLTILHFCDDPKMPSLSHIPIPKILDAPLDSANYRHIIVNISL